MEYAEYIARYNAQKEREAQLIKKYSDKPQIPANRSLQEVFEQELQPAMPYPETRLWLQVLAGTAILSAIVLAYCIFS